MSVLNLRYLLNPQSVALIGASTRSNSVGNVVMKNLLDAGFHGPILPVNPKARTVRGVLAYPDIASLPVAPDLGVICTPAASVPKIIHDLGARGARAAVIISSGFNETVDGISLQQKTLDAAQAYGLRILGPNCVGLLVAGIGLNASFAHTHALDGRLALLSQSGALCTTILDWAQARGIGFSHCISMGDMGDVDFGDLIDYLGSDPKTSAILMYVESVVAARKFISAARATSRNKKIIVIKSGRYAEGARAAASHTGAMAGDDAVFDAAIRRSGMLRVLGIDELFAAAETLAHGRHVTGKRLAIVTNGGGTGVLATDQLIAHEGILAELSSETQSALNEVLPASWSHANPVDIIGDGDAERYARTLRILFQDPNYDVILVMLVPSAVIDNARVAEAVAEELTQTSKPVLTCWMGDSAVAKARQIFRARKIPTYDTPELAVKAFMHMHDYELNQRSLLETPASAPEEFHVDPDGVGAVINAALNEDRELLTEVEAKDVLAKYAVNTVTTQVAHSPAEAVRIAKHIGFPIALKILSKDITHKSDVGGVLLGIESAAVLEASAEGMLTRIKQCQPDASVEGFAVQPMISRPKAYELILGVHTDPIFGPVILFGEGGTAVEVIKDRAIALPPLNQALARQLIQRTRISKLLAGYRGTQPVALTDIELTLVKLSHLVANHPEIIELDINPLLADEDGVLALDARIRVAPAALSGSQRFAIRPYPKELEETVEIDGEALLLRPIRPEDEPAHKVFIDKLSFEDLYFRFFRAVGDLSHDQLARFTQIDYAREMAFIATRHTHTGEETLGVVRAVANADNTDAEFALIVRSDFQGRDLGRALLEKMIRYCKEHGIERLCGQALSSKQAMIHLAKDLGFSVIRSDHSDGVELELILGQ
nr:GNAT family N-acetyltransferase [Oceanococcus sp. HetDA_MAG_MS8]